MIELKGGVAQRGREELPLRHARQRMLEARMTCAFRCQESQVDAEQLLQSFLHGAGRQPRI
jgi:hypothetical protein